MALEKQSVLLKMRWPTASVTKRKDELVWIGHLQPTAVSPEYTVQMTYRLWYSPRVAVLDPVLDPGHRERLPHVYSADDLCLYTPGEWNATMPLATTIVPWTAEWLFHYEAWKVTDVWHGGGDAYAPKDDEPERTPAQWASHRSGVGTTPMRERLGPPPGAR
jgi:hypothetical protein